MAVFPARRFAVVVAALSLSASVTVFVDGEQLAGVTRVEYSRAAYDDTPIFSYPDMPDVASAPSFGLGHLAAELRMEPRPAPALASRTVVRRAGPWASRARVAS